jgi:hypothetical protein
MKLGLSISYSAAAMALPVELVLPVDRIRERYPAWASSGRHQHHRRRCQTEALELMADIAELRQPAGASS